VVVIAQQRACEEFDIDSTVSKTEDNPVTYSCRSHAREVRYLYRVLY
jgi:hypothetical protein